MTIYLNEFKEPSDIENKNVDITKSRARDFNYLDKKVGYLTQVQTDFSFIDPDRKPVELD